MARVGSTSSYNDIDTTPKKTTPQQDTDSEGYAVLKTTERSVYSTIDQHKDGNAHPRPRPNQGLFFNREAPPSELTDAAKKIISEANK